MNAYILRWSVWAPGIENDSRWARWAEAPFTLDSNGAPEAKFLPPMLRRRCTPFTRTVLTAAFSCLDDDDRAECETVFASRHGNLNESAMMLEKVVRGERLSPTLFSHTVHNAQAGLFAIAAGNRGSSSAIAAETETFQAGFLEALLKLARQPQKPVLFVTGDAPVGGTFRSLVDEPKFPYAVGLVLASDGVGTPVEFDLVPQGASQAAEGTRWPTAFEFLRWLTSEGSEFLSPGTSHAWRWRKKDSA